MGDDRGGGPLYESKDQREKMAELQGVPPHRKQRTKIFVPRNGATEPDEGSSVPSRSALLQQELRDRSFDDRRRRARGPPSSPYHLFDTLYQKPGPSSQTPGSDSLAKASRHGLTIDGFSLTSPPRARASESGFAGPGFSDKKKRPIEGGSRSPQQHQPPHRPSTRHVTPAKRQRTLDDLDTPSKGPQREVIDVDGSSQDDSAGPSQVLVSHKISSSPVPAKSHHLYFDDSGEELRPGAELRSKPDPPEASEQDRAELSEALLVKHKRLHDQSSKMSHGQPNSSGNGNSIRGRPPGVIVVEEPGDVSGTSVEPIVIGSQSQEAGRAERPRAPSQPKGGGKSSTFVETLASHAPPTGISSRMKGKRSAQNDAAAAKTDGQRKTTSHKRRTAEVVDLGSAYAELSASECSTKDPGPTEIALKAVVISDVWRLEKLPNLYLLVHDRRIIFGQGAPSAGNNIELRYDDIQSMECSRERQYENCLVKIKLNSNSSGERSVKALWPEFDTRAVEDASGIVLIPKPGSDTHSQGLFERSWDRVLLRWRGQLGPTQRLSWLDEAAVRTIGESCSPVPQLTSWPQPMGEGGSNNPQLVYSRKLIRPGETRPTSTKSPVRDADHLFSRHQEPKSEVQRNGPQSKAFTLTTPEDHLEDAADHDKPSKPALAGPSRRPVEIGSRIGSPHVSTSTAPRRTKPGNEEVLRFPYEGPGSVTLIEADLERLNDGEFLNDTLIEFGLKLLLDQIRQKNPALADQIHIFSSFFYKRLTEFSVKKSYQNVRKWTNKVDLFSKKYVVLPINEQYHWYLAIVVNPWYMTKPTPVKPVPAPSPRLTRGSFRGLLSSDDERTEEQNAKLPSRSSTADIVMDDAAAAKNPGSETDMDVETPSPPRGHSRGDSATSDLPPHRRRRSATGDSNGLNDIRTPPLPSPELVLADLDAFTSSLTKGTSPLPSAGAPSILERTARAASTSAKSVDRQLTGSVESQGVEPSTMPSDLQQMSLSSFSGIPAASAVSHIPVLDRRTGTQDELGGSPSRTGLVRLAGVEAQASRADQDNPDERSGRSTAPAKAANEVADRRHPEASREDPVLSNHAPDDVASLDEIAFDDAALGDSTEDDYADVEPPKPVVRRPFTGPSSVSGSQERQSPALDTAAFPRGFLRSRTRSGRLDAARHSPNLEPEAAAVSPGFEMLDDIDADPLRGMRIGGGPGWGRDEPALTEHKPRKPSTKIVPGADRAASPLPADPWQRRESHGDGTIRLPEYRPSAGAPAHTFPEQVAQRSSSLKTYAAQERTAAASDAVDLEQTIVITFDSLGMNRRSVNRHMREYLFYEAQDKGKLEDPSMTIGRAPTPTYVKAQVPAQPNYADCGIYLMHYFERFFSDPEAFLRLVVSQEAAKGRVTAGNRQEWEAERVADQREFWRAKILELGEDWKAWKAVRDDAAAKERKRNTAEHKEREPRQEEEERREKEEAAPMELDRQERADAQSDAPHHLGEPGDDHSRPAAGQAQDAERKVSKGQPDRPLRFYADRRLLSSNVSNVSDLGSTLDSDRESGIEDFSDDESSKKRSAEPQLDAVGIAARADAGAGADGASAAVSGGAWTRSRPANVSSRPEAGEGPSEGSRQTATRSPSCSPAHVAGGSEAGETPSSTMGASRAGPQRSTVARDSHFTLGPGPLATARRSLNPTGRPRSARTRGQRTAVISVDDTSEEDGG